MTWVVVTGVGDPGHRNNPLYFLAHAPTSSSTLKRVGVYQTEFWFKATSFRTEQEATRVAKEAAPVVGPGVVVPFEIAMPHYHWVRYSWLPS